MTPVCVVSGGTSGWGEGLGRKYCHKGQANKTESLVSFNFFRPHRICLNLYHSL